ncbi:hypothetical protein EYF80_040177 [Liparis tanakae]|uniref:Uncharacterized protein n=1 Tax=Liparis tanakae TaxID=230148 RepID=A0A4Z2G7Y6_9TELE|nr:hypothetical protein EYF80_040177 [Liparis tanakae]
MQSSAVRHLSICNRNSPAAIRQVLRAQMAVAVEPGSAHAGLRSLFFMLTPNETSYQRLEDVPEYVLQQTIQPRSANVCDLRSSGAPRASAPPRPSGREEQTSRAAKALRASSSSAKTNSGLQKRSCFHRLMVLELVVGWLKKGSPVVTVRDGLTSVACGMISRFPL